MRRILLSVCFCCMTLAVAAMSGKFYSSEQLASSSVMDICQDDYGFIWIATDYGLSRFDGYRFTNYYHVQRDSTTLPDNYVNCFLPDGKGNLWVGHAKGLCRYDYASESFIRLPFPNGVEPRVNTMVQDKDGNIFLGTAGVGMYKLSGGNITRCGEFSDQSNNKFIAHLHIDKKGNLWCGNHKDMAYLYVMKGGKMKSYKAFHSEKGEPMAFVDIDEQNVLLVCKKGILRYNYTTGTLAETDYDLSVADGNLTMTHAFLAPSGNLYIGTNSQGLLVIDKGGKTARKEPLMENHRQQGAPYVSHIMQDKNEHLWLTCFGTGIFLASQQVPAFDSWSLARQDTQFAGRLTAIAPDGKGGAWCAVRQGILYHIDHQGLFQSRIATQPELLSICWERDQRYWLGAGNTLYFFDAATEKPQKKQEFEGISIGQIISDHNGNLYISVYGKGFYKYDTSTGATQAFNASMESPNGKLCNDWVEYMMMDSHQRLWLSTATGVSCMDPSDGSFNSMGWNMLLEEIACGSLCETKEHDIVIGTSKGLYLYRHKLNQAERFPGAEQLEDMSISSIVEDSRGDLWISTSQGIWQYIREKKRFVSHLNGNGLSTREYVAGATFTLSDGRIAFGQHDGLTLFNPLDIQSPDDYSGKVHLTRFLRDGKPVDFRSDTFIIPYDENSFLMEFSVLDYENTDNVSFQYRLNEGQWVSTARGSNVISFGKMKPGTYQIDVRAESNGEASSEVLTLTVVVENPWYLSTWACWLYALLALGIIGMVAVYWRNKVRMRLDMEKLNFLLKANHNLRTSSRYRILIVGSDVETANSIISELNFKFKFDYAPNGKEALKILVGNTYDLVISEMMMSGMDGITMLKRIKGNSTISETPVIILSSKEEVEHKLLGLKAGADAYIAKPINIDELHLQMDNLIDNVHRLRGKFSGALQQEGRVENVEVKGNDDALMERIMRSVNAHMSDSDYNVDVLASDVGLSRAQLHRKMKEITGIATGRFLRNLRMEQAARLLREGNVNVSQVADKVGYADQAHFSTAFKTHYGMSPSEYMEKNRGN